jgi:hypothetical protein
MVTANASERRRVHIRLIHDGVQPSKPLEEPLRFGLQDSKGEVSPGSVQSGEVQTFDFVVEVKELEVVFTGAFAHGPAAGRFLYLSWRREGVQENPWGRRIKIPLAGIDWAKIRAAEKPGKRLAADVIGRGTHTSEIWRVEACKVRAPRRPSKSLDFSPGSADSDILNYTPLR